MICPKCKHDMIVVEHQKIELDYCPNCEGLWFDAGELNLLLECSKLASPDLTINNIVALPPVEPSGKKLKCPICRQAMKQVAIGQPKINIDVCVNEEGLWFDGGELHALLRQLVAKSAPKASPELPVLDFLGEVFKGTE